PAPARRLIRRKQQAADVLTLDRLTYGTLVSRVARLHPHGGQYDLSMAVGEIVPALRKESAKVGKDFGTLVRERRRKWGLPIPVQDKLLPFRSPLSSAPASQDASTAETPAGVSTQSCDTPETAPTAEETPPTAPDASADLQAIRRLALAEQRLQAVLNELQAVSTRGAPPWEIHRWEQAYDDEMRTYEIAYTACQVVQRSDNTPPPDTETE
ncbi:MAG TPA: hypothetical protein VKQ36_04890, partial [Ktedonobacterales bacterium]|nr:hypothetical protein [Ktedonobacterales bacterium]